MMLPPGGPPPSINLPGAGGPAGPGGSDGPDTPGVSANLQKAEKALQAALMGEKDPQDKAVISGLINKLHTIEAGRAKEADTAMGSPRSSSSSDVRPRRSRARGRRRQWPSLTPPSRRS
jgi:hypothetical protein